MMTRARSFTSIPLLAVIAATTSSAANLDFLEHSPISDFTPQDMELMHQNALKVLDDPARNAMHAWSNGSTGASGLAQVRGQFTASDGTTCKRLRILNSAKGLEGEATYTLCKYPDRGWAIHTQAQPAQ